MKHIEQTSYGLIALGMLIAAMCIFFVEPEQRTLINVLSVVGSVASLFGIAIAVLQTWSARLTAETTKQLVQETRNAVLTRLAGNEVIKAVQFIREIQTHLHARKVELALLRCRDLKAFLIEFRINNTLAAFNQPLKNERLLTDLIIVITNLETVVMGNNVTLDFEDLLKRLENLSTEFITFESVLKTKSL